MRSMGNILVVDDDDTIRELVAMALSDEGYEVQTAAHGGEALELAGRCAPHLILLDMRMPVMDGWEFARVYRATRGAHAPIVVLTAGRDAAAAAQEIGADGFLPKPFDLDSLLGLVSTMLAGRSPEGAPSVASRQQYDPPAGADGTRGSTFGRPMPPA